MAIDVEAKLQHSITIVPVGVLNRYGELSESTPVTSVPCYIDGSIARVLNDRGEQVQADFTIIFLPAANIGVGFKVRDGVDVTGYSLLPAGKVVSVEEYNHYEDGQLAREAYVVRG